MFLSNFSTETIGWHIKGVASNSWCWLDTDYLQPRDNSLDTSRPYNVATIIDKVEQGTSAKENLSGEPACFTCVQDASSPGQIQSSSPWKLFNIFQGYVCSKKVITVLWWGILNDNKRLRFMLLSFGMLAWNCICPTPYLQFLYSLASLLEQQGPHFSGYFNNKCCQNHTLTP